MIAAANARDSSFAGIVNGAASQRCLAMIGICTAKESACATREAPPVALCLRKWRAAQTAFSGKSIPAGTGRADDATAAPAAAVAGGWLAMLSASSAQQTGGFQWPASPSVERGRRLGVPRRRARLRHNINRRGDSITSAATGKGAASFSRIRPAAVASFPAVVLASSNGRLCVCECTRRFP